MSKSMNEPRRYFAYYCNGECVEMTEGYKIEGEDHKFDGQDGYIPVIELYAYDSLQLKLYETQSQLKTLAEDIIETHIKLKPPTVFMAEKARKALEESEDPPPRSGAI